MLGLVLKERREQGKKKKRKEKAYRKALRQLHLIVLNCALQ